MEYTLENDDLLIKVNSKGAELTKIFQKKAAIDYLWHGDATYWGRHAPILFPFVGKSKNDQYSFADKTYPMGQHGFARDKEFLIEKIDDRQLRCILKADATTIEIYPFQFVLEIVYTLSGDSLNVAYEVYNAGQETLYFSIGAHPAFNVPLTSGTQFEDYQVSVTPRIAYERLNLLGPLVDLSQTNQYNAQLPISLTRDIFKNDAIILKTPMGAKINIFSEKTPHSVTLSYQDFPFVGIWSPNDKEAPFVCIEPWHGIADTVDTTGELTEKFGVQQLDVSESFFTDYTIEIK